MLEHEEWGLLTLQYALITDQIPTMATDGKTYINPEFVDHIGDDSNFNSYMNFYTIY